MMRTESNYVGNFIMEREISYMKRRKFYHYEKVVGPVGPVESQLGQPARLEQLGQLRIKFKWFN